MAKQATWMDIFSLILTITVVGGLTVGLIWIYRTFREHVQSTKEKFKQKGVDISRKGVSVKTSKRMDREGYVDATQRGFIRAMEASSFGKPQSPTLSPNGIDRSVSSSSSGSSTNSASGKKGFLRRK